MNNPLRAFVQEKYEVKNLINMAEGQFEYVLEIGCGRGIGTTLIKKYFSPKNIIGIDLDERMIELAKNRNDDPSIVFQVMDASKLEFPDNSFDAVFDFGIIHHIPNWRDCLREIYAVLKQDGQLIMEDLSTESFEGIGKIWKSLLTHPYESMYTFKEFIEFLENNGFEIVQSKKLNPLFLMKYFTLTSTKKI